MDVLRGGLAGAGLAAALVLAAFAAALEPGDLAAQASGSWAVSTLTTGEPLPSAGRLGGLSVDGAGNIYVANFGASVWKVAPGGAVHRVLGDLQGSSGNVVLRDGRLLQASFLDNRIVEVTPDGASRVFTDQGLDGPVGITEDAAGRVYVCNCRGNSISVVESDRTTRVVASGGDLDCPNGITEGPGGLLYVVSYRNAHVVAVSPDDGRMRRFVSLPPGGSAHIAYLWGSLYVTRIATGELVRVEPDGRWTAVLGEAGQGLRDGAPGVAQLAHPNGIAAGPDGRFLFINDLDGPWKTDEEARIVIRKVGPFEMEPLDRISITVGDLRFDALAAGPPDGTLVLLLHGFPETSYAFRHQLRALGALGFRAVAPDQRGYSPGARPEGVQAYGMGNLSGDVLGMADALGRETFDLVGHDWGGAVAWVVATRAPRRVRTLTVFSTPHYGALSAGRAAAGSDQAERSAYFSDFAATGAEKRFLADDAAYLRRLYGDLPRDAVEAYLRVLGNPETLRAALAWYAAAFGPTAGAATPPSAPPAAARVKPVPVPTLYVWSTEDGAFGREAAEATRAYVSGPYRFEVLEGVDHWIVERVPEVASRLIVEQILNRGGGAPTDAKGVRPR